MSKCDKVDQQIGDYRLVQLLGQGGCACVYLGRHVTDPKKRAAIKILHAHVGEEIEERFLQEAEIIKSLEHQHIIRLLDSGSDRDKALYLIMEYAPNGTLRDRHPQGCIVPLATVAEYVEQIADALQYAHEHGVNHRDLKPENLLVGENSEILLSDFGISAIVYNSLLQRTGAYIGTPHYSAPEQIEGKPRRASDQYALGVIVYEWLTGERPFQGTAVEVISQHVHKPPRPLRERVATIPTQVETVVLKALAKDPTKRFESAQAFAEAFEEASQHSSVSPTTIPLPRLSTKGSRRKVLFVGAGAMVAVATGGILFALSRAPVIQHKGPASVVPAAASVVSVAWSTDSTHIASCSSDEVRVWNAINGGSLHLTYIAPSHATMWSVAWSPDGVFIVSGSADKNAYIWNAINEEGTLRTYKGHSDAVNAVAWSPKGTYIASGSADSTVRVWERGRGRTLMIHTGHTKPVTSVAWSPDGTYIASGSRDMTVRVWDARGRALRTYKGHSDQVNGIVWSPDGKHIASASDDNTVQVWEPTTGRSLQPYKGHTKRVTSVAWSPDSRRIVSGSWDRTVQVWDAASGTLLYTYPGHTDYVNTIAWSPDSKHIASGSVDKSIHIWEI